MTYFHIEKLVSYHENTRKQIHFCLCVTKTNSIYWHCLLPPSNRVSRISKTINQISKMLAKSMKSCICRRSIQRTESILFRRCRGVTAIGNKCTFDIQKYSEVLRFTGMRIDLESLTRDGHSLCHLLMKGLIARNQRRWIRSLWLVWITLQSRPFDECELLSASSPAAVLYVYVSKTVIDISDEMRISQGYLFICKTLLKS